MLPVAWSLPYEILFYLVFGLTVWLPLLGWTLFGVWLLLILAFGLFHLSAGFPLSVLTQPYNIQTILGMALASTYLRFQKDLSGRCQGTVLVLAGLAAFCAIFAFTSNSTDALLLRTGYGFASCLIIIGCLSYEQARPVNLHIWWFNFGQASYSVYLLHWPIAYVAILGISLCHAWHTASHATWLCLVAVTTTLICIGFHCAVERPLQAFLRKRFNTG